MDIRFFLVTALFNVVWAAPDLQQAKAFLQKVNDNLKAKAHQVILKEWDFKTDMNTARKTALQTAKENYFAALAGYISETHDYLNGDYDSTTKNQFNALKQWDEAALTVEDRKQLTNLINSMGEVYTNTKVKATKDSSSATLSYPDVSSKISKNFGNVEELNFYWKEWHETIGRKQKDNFQKYVVLMNKMAKANSYNNNAELWQNKYGIAGLEDEVERLYQQIKPLLLDLHAYVRQKLSKTYSIDSDGPIPANLLGNLWGNNGEGIYSITKPFPGEPPIDVANSLKNLNGLEIARKAAKFFYDLGFPDVDGVLRQSILQQPPGQQNIECAQQSFNFFDDKTYKIKYCAGNTLNDFGGLCHEIGNIENFMSLNNVPFLLQRSPDEGFSGAVGEVAQLFTTSPEYLKKSGLLTSFSHSENKQLNYLMQQGLYIVLFIPYALSLEKWRWEVFKGSIKPEQYNCKYWNLRQKYQGVSPPVPRSNQDFDAGAKHQIGNNEQVISYFLSVILQYQIHQALCIKAGEYKPNNPNAKPLYLCDITNNKANGDSLKNMVKIGVTESWKNALKSVTGSDTISAQPLMDFFKPLHDWLRKENKGITNVFTETDYCATWG